MTVDRINLGDLSAVLPGTYTIATLPPASSHQAKYAYVTDLGGGADMVLSDGAYWKHIRRGIIGYVAAATTVALTPLSSPTIIGLTGSNLLNLTGAVTLSTSGLYQGYETTVIVPSGLVGLGTTLGIKVAGGSLIPLAGNSWSDLQYDGTSLIKIRGSSFL